MKVAHAFESERIRRHFVAVEKQLATREARHLDPMRRLVRSLLLEELAHYREERRYPKNTEFGGKAVPCFVDENGTRCAVAHLLHVSGLDDVAATIAKRRRYARVPELSDEERLVAWLDATGLSLEEAARIQPAYCQTFAALCFCFWSAPTVAEGVVVGSQFDDGGTTLEVRLDRIEGAPSERKVGDVVQFNGRLGATSGAWSMPGGRWLLGISPQSNGVSFLEPVGNGYGVDVTETHVTCPMNEFTRANPVPKDVVLEALLTNDRASMPWNGNRVTACEERLAEHEAGWKTAQCDNTGLDPGTGSAAGAAADGAGGCQCRMNGPDASRSLPKVTSAAVLAAILGYRRKRRANARSAGANRGPI